MNPSVGLGRHNQEGGKIGSQGRSSVSIILGSSSPYLFQVLWTLFSILLGILFSLPKFEGILLLVNAFNGFDWWQCSWCRREKTWSWTSRNSKALAWPQSSLTQSRSAWCTKSYHSLCPYRRTLNQTASIKNTDLKKKNKLTNLSKYWQRLMVELSPPSRSIDEISLCPNVLWFFGRRWHFLNYKITRNKRRRRSIKLKRSSCHQAFRRFFCFWYKVKGRGNA